MEIREIITTEGYNELLKNKKVVLKCSADWCAPCKVLSNTIRKLNEEKLDGFVFGEINVEDDFSDFIVSTYGIRGLPTLLFFKDGSLVDKAVGNIPSEKIYEIIEKNF